MEACRATGPRAAARRAIESGRFALPAAPALPSRRDSPATGWPPRPRQVMRTTTRSAGPGSEDWSGWVGRAKVGEATVRRLAHVAAGGALHFGRGGTTPAVLWGGATPIS